MENRLKEAVQKVNAREQRLASEFEFSAKFLNSSAYRKEKLKDYEQILKKKWHGLSREEKLYRKLLRQQCNEMEKKLYPNRYIRLLKNFTKLALAMGSVIKRPVLDQPILQTSLLRKSGFADIQPKAESLVKKGIDDFVVPMNRSMSAKHQVEFNISFSRDGKHVKPDKIIASLQTEGEAGQKSIAVNMDSDGKTLNQRQLYNLLAGRFVKQGDNWLRVDFNDCDADGKLKVKEFTAVDFEMRQELKKLPGWQQLNAINMGKIIEGLENGDRIRLPADLGLGKETGLQVNPLKREIELFGSDGSKIIDEKQSQGKQLDLIVGQSQDEHKEKRTAKVRRAV